MRGSSLDASRRAYLGLARGTIAATNDSPKMQTIDVRVFQNELHASVERMQTYGHSSVPLPPDADGKSAEVVIGYINGNRSHRVVIATDDRRYRPKNLKPGESAHHDDQGQILHLARDGYKATAKKHTFTAGSQPDTSGFELNEQLKGLAARLAQAENNLHGLFDVTSQFRAIVQQVIPTVAAVAPILNQAPSGLEAMASAIEGKAQAYLQKQVEQALAKFLSPNLAGLQSLVSGGLEGIISNLQSQITSMLTSNPAVAQADALAAELAALTSSGSSQAVIALGTTILQAKINALTSANPAIGAVNQLRSTLDSLISQAGPALNFLAPQQNLVKGVSKSLRLGGP